MADRHPGERRGTIVLAAAVISAALSVVYLVWQPQTQDLAAQVFRADLWEQHGWVLYNDAWYGGHTAPGYSLLYPPLGAWLGPAILGVICAVTAAVLFALIAIHAYGRWAWLGVAWFGLASTVSLFGGRITFGLGLVLGLAAGLAMQRRRPVWAGLAAVGAGLASPVAGLFTAIAGASVLIAARLSPVSAPSRERLVRSAWVVVLAAVAATIVLSLAFPTPGYQPFTLTSFLWIPIVCAICLMLLPVGETTLRCGVAIYLIVGVCAFLLLTPFGGNAVRFGAVFAGPVMALALFGRRPIALILIAAPLLWWQWTATVRDVVDAQGDPATKASYFAPLVAELDRLSEGSVIRVEVPPTANRWESVYVAEQVPLARGWLRQLESADFEEFTKERLTASGYEDWLRAHHVDYVAVSDGKLDYLANDEASLITGGFLPYLEPVWSNEHWRLFSVTESEAAQGSDVELDALGPDGFSLSVPGSGRFTIPLRYSPYLEIVEGRGCLEEGDDDNSTVLTVPAGIGPQQVEVRASFSLGGLLRRDLSCQ